MCVYVRCLSGSGEQWVRRGRGGVEEQEKEAEKGRIDVGQSVTADVTPGCRGFAPG